MQVTHILLAVPTDKVIALDKEADEKTYGAIGVHDVLRDDIAKLFSCQPEDVKIIPLGTTGSYK